MQTSFIDLQTAPECEVLACMTFQAELNMNICVAAAGVPTILVSEPCPKEHSDSEG